jgi:hypothetical protein
MHFLSQAQTFTVEVRIKNLPPNHIIFGSVSGDNFTPIDSFIISNPVSKIVFQFPANAHRGVYRINFGTTTYARVMKEGPQLLDFIFDNESVILETAFKSPVESLKIIKSKENDVWYAFQAKDRVFKRDLKSITDLLDGYWKKSDTANAERVANDFNQLQMDRDMFLMQTVQENRGLFVSQMIKNLREPILDGFLTPAERNKSFKKEFFKSLDFSNPDLINTSVYTDVIFNYLVGYNHPDFTKKQRETEYIRGVDMIMANVKTNEAVRQFVLGYLVHGFRVLEMQNVINYIAKKYGYTSR